MNIYTVADHILSPLGASSKANFDAIASGKSGVSRMDNKAFCPFPLYVSKLDRALMERELPYSPSSDYTFTERLFIGSIERLLTKVKAFDKSKTILIISTTKGNVHLLEGEGQINEQRVELPTMAAIINQHLQLPNNPLVVSNACISGVSAILLAKKLIAMGMYEHAIVSGGDVISEFIASGFQAFKAMDDAPCKPYDAHRLGINLGEGFGSLFISSDRNLCVDEMALSKISGGGQTNDANHISGPSRTGSGLKLAVEKALQEAAVSASDIDLIGAHGTGTIFNDEMEAIAFNDLSMSRTPLNSLKGYFGHTLGGAGVIESIISIRQMNAGIFLASKGFQTPGVSKKIEVLQKTRRAENPKHVLKTISGFGGCNAAVILSKP